MLWEFEYAGEKVLNDQLPTFPNLKRLELRCGVENFFWDKLILPFLNCSPALETLVFTEGLTLYYEDGDGCFDGKLLELERDFFRTDHAIPSCCSRVQSRLRIGSSTGSYI
ncbi:hypothetical protein BVRB_5g108790 [Beta vulgaris subsp. vulgaris]|nr:hypothetical protein BVRB_5g108790 [Beta vulgaris subsp. vulgaris]